MQRVIMNMPEVANGLLFTKRLAAIAIRVWPLAAAIAALDLLYFATQKLLRAHPAHERLRDFASIFDLNAEANIPTWFSSAMWLWAAFLSFRLSRVVRREGGPRALALQWGAVGLLCAFLSMDEAAEFHERAGDVLGDFLPRGMPIYGWEWIGASFAALAAIAFLPFIRSLSIEIAALMLFAGAIFLTGALGFETWGALLQRGYIGSFPLGLSWVQVIMLEETCEMAGTALFVTAIHACGER